MKDDFFKFPSTPHFSIHPGVDIRSDKVLTQIEREEFLKNKITIEEKVDGANLGISFDREGNIRAQNRGAYLRSPCTGQWKKLDEWLALRSDILFEHLFDQYILFGEWCFAQHTVSYDRLPDWFLGFDLYDRVSERFLSSRRRDEKLELMKISKVPCLARGRFSHQQLEDLLSQSQLTNQLSEGIYLRHDHGDWLQDRAKLVRPAFIQTVEEHWSRAELKPNRLRDGRF